MNCGFVCRVWVGWFGFSGVPVFFFLCFGQNFFFFVLVPGGGGFFCGWIFLTSGLEGGCGGGILFFPFFSGGGGGAGVSPLGVSFPLGFQWGLVTKFFLVFAVVFRGGGGVQGWPGWGVVCLGRPLGGVWVRGFCVKPIPGGKSRRWPFWGFLKKKGAPPHGLFLFLF